MPDVDMTSIDRAVEYAREKHKDQLRKDGSPYIIHPLAVAEIVAEMGLDADAVLGAKNWLEIGGISFQPSELVKVLYIYAGASTLDRLFRRRNLYSFIAFSAFSNGTTTK